MQHTFLLKLAVLGALISLLLIPPRFPVPAPGAILVTGAGSGIGRHCALELAARLPHHTVYGMVRSDEHARELEHAGRVTAVVADLANETSLDALVARIREPLVGFFDAAGVPILNAPVEAIDVSRLRAIYEADVFGLVTLLARVVPRARAAPRGGRLVFMGSVTGAVTPAFMGMDAARAIETVADAARRELAPHDVAVTVVQAGFVRSPIIGKTHAIDSEVLGSARGRAMLEAYPKLAAKDYEKQVAPEAMSPMSVVSDAVLDALTSPRPRIRYIVGKVPSPIPTWLLVPLLHVLPHHIIDLFE